MKLSRAVISRCPKESGSATLAAILSGWKARPTFKTSFKGVPVWRQKYASFIIMKLPRAEHAKAVNTNGSFRRVIGNQLSVISSLVTRSLVTRSLVTRSLVTRSVLTAHWSLVTRSLLTAHCSLVTGHSVTAHWSLVTRSLGHSSLVTRHWSLVTGHSSLVTRHSSLVTGHSVTRHWSLGHWSLVTR
jgi:hypothetical protein